jgi:hypothetical protein
MRIARTAAAGAAVLGAVLLTAEAFRLGAADTLLAESSATLESAAWRSARPSLDAWLAVRDALLRAERLAPGSPGVAETLGVLHARRAASPEMLAHAKDYLRRSLERRPASPYTWASFAEVKYLLGEVDPSLEGALVNMAELGPWEPEVQLLGADIGLALFDVVTPQARRSIERLVENGMRRNPSATLQVANKRGRLDVACRFVQMNRKNAVKQFTICERGRTT